ncbi:delta 8-sphingoloid desaturase protein [Macrolepiota fuliginosa MF-IS2]|uniref:Delta 8-(E)-sphingolipid desaturase n=1 Tax=Macrolepiota fuliginosa MF-IS2 TaxID=1400762 RepID=A0A9P6CAK2_9AGAR|nr:delta 8-sphingoloid desaturase protein [Macrolepiota fuliginosa MF-IS2]
MGQTTLWSRQDVVARILAGELLLIYQGLLLRIPQSWLDAHPGGSLALLHFVGRDATDEIEAYHSNDTLRMVKRFSIGRVDLVDDLWEPLVPPIMSGWVRRLNSDGKSEWYREAAAARSAENTQLSPSSQILLVDKDLTVQSHAPTLATLSPPPTDLSLKVQARHSKAYRELHKRIVDADLYKTPYITGYGPEVLRYTLLAGISAYAYSHNWLMTSAVFLGLTWHQLVFSAHDLGHMGVTHNWAVDRILAILIADFIGGLSIGWWVQNHNVHHLVTNHPSHDPDIEHLPFFAISPVFFSSLWSSYYKRIMHFDRFAKIVVAIQHKLFYIVMMFARFNLYANSYGYLYKKAWDTKRARGGRWAFWLEIVGLLFFWSWFGAVLYGCGSWQKALAYLLISHAVTSPLHVQIVLSHFTMSTADLGPTESFPHRQMRTTTDVICPESIGFMHGGLHLQVTHHLFPRLPRHNLRQASELVKEFAKEQGLVYAEFGFVDGNKEVLGVLRGVAEQVKLIGTVAKAEAQEAVERKIAAAEKKAN